MTSINMKDFARDVERLCDFLLDKVENNGTADVAVILDLKNTAANIQFEQMDTLNGLSAYMKGVPAP